QYWHGEIVLAPPQIMSLSHLCLFKSVAHVMTEAAQRKPTAIMPEPFDQDGMRVICYPGDPRHPVPQRAMPGPTRLQFRNKRFEPEGGLEALLHGPL
ncbi:MAG: NUDIX hydrolase, partial [Limnohabitans sp.]